DFADESPNVSALVEELIQNKCKKFDLVQEKKQLLKQIERLDEE
ncbi:15384_t:CDS:2, partial [Gigaspora rosea]